MQSQIIKMLIALDETLQIKIDKELHKKHLDEVVTREEALLAAFGDNEKLKELYRDFDMATLGYQATMERGYYREGFICGAKIALEICGVYMDE